MTGNFTTLSLAVHIYLKSYYINNIPLINKFNIYKYIK